MLLVYTSNYSEDHAHNYKKKKILSDVELMTIKFCNNSSCLSLASLYSDGRRGWMRSSQKRYSQERPKVIVS